MIHRDQFVVQGAPREVNGNAVEALDRLLAQAAGMPVERILHGIDPRRILRFEAGGPPVWSTALCPCPDGAFLFVTYGLSRHIDPEAPFDHEMSIRVAGDGTGTPPSWPTFFLRALARYQIQSGRELRAGDPMAFGEPITRVAMAPEHKASMPSTALDAIAVIDDPQMPNVRRAYGLTSAEQAMAAPWSMSGLLGELARRDPHLTTRLDRPTFCDDPTLTRAIEEGAARDGSSTGALVVPGLRWAQTDSGFEVSIPGSEVKKIASVLPGRIQFGRNLLLHGHDPTPGSEVGITAAPQMFVRPRSDIMLEIGAPPERDLFISLIMAARTEHPAAVTLRFTSNHP